MPTLKTHHTASKLLSMPWYAPLVTRYMLGRHQQLAYQHYQVPLESQQQVFRDLMNQVAKTSFGKEHGLVVGSTPADFAQKVPIRSYEELFPYIQRALKGEDNVLWPGRTKWFSKSSGTTNARSKYIPVTDANLHGCHYKAGKDMFALYLKQVPGSRLFHGPQIALGGSLQPNPEGGPAQCGDVSAVMMQNMPWWAKEFRKPRLELALMPEFEEKLEQMAKETLKMDVTGISGVPTWNVVLLRRLLELSGKEHIHQVWPNLEVFFHGAVAFGPYRQLFNELAPGSNMHYMELYNASEGFFGIQDQMSLQDEMLLMLSHGVYYELLPLEELESSQPQCLTSLAEAETGRNYALVISTNAGLWRYLIGDTIRFTSTLREGGAFRFKITGRTRSFINVFGEELMVENAEAAVIKACQLTGAAVSNFTAAPVYMPAGGKGGHEWIIEFERKPHDLDQFAQTLDDALRQVNSDYDAKRHRDLALQRLILHAAPEGTFYHWLKYKGKLGGQHKVPRLSNERHILEELFKFLHEA